MAGTNPDEPAIDDSKPVTEDDLRALKYDNEDVEPPQEEDEPELDDETEDEPEETPDEDDKIDESEADEPEAEEPEATSFVKEFDFIKGDTPEEYAKNLEAAYKNSSTEALRLKGELDTLKAPPTAPAEAPAEDEDAPQIKNPVNLYVQQKLDEEIQGAFDITKQEYPQVNDPAEYDKFTRKVAVFSQTILDTENRLASPKELYDMAAASLKWEKQGTAPDKAEELAMAVKNGAATSKATAAPSKPKAPGPKISEAQLKLNRKMYPGKTDSEIIKELTPYL